MSAIIIRRLIAAVPVLFLILSLTFFLMHNAPGSPFSTERHIPAPIMAELEKKYHLHGTFGQQYREYLWDLVHGDLGLSTQYRNRTVNEIIAQALPVSMVLGTLAYSFALVAGITLGGLAAVRHGRGGDRLIVLAALLGISIPSFVVALLLVQVFAIDLHLLPVAGWGSLDQLVLPAFCLSLPFVASIARLTRGGMLEVLRLDFIRTARAKGLAESTVLFRHALKVAVLPVIGYSGPAIAGVLTGSIIVETIFGIPGIGPFFVNSVLNRDPFMTCGVVAVFGLFLILCNLVADILYFVVDRRVNLQ
jgi:ABC-type dipeptide/oligopeptide/nickel transport system permease component